MLQDSCIRLLLADGCYETNIVGNECEAVGRARLGRREAGAAQTDSNYA